MKKLFLFSLILFTASAIAQAPTKLLDVRKTPVVDESDLP